MHGGAGRRLAAQDLKLRWGLIWGMSNQYGRGIGQVSSLFSVSSDSHRWAYVSAEDAED